MTHEENEQQRGYEMYCYVRDGLQPSDVAFRALADNIETHLQKEKTEMKNKEQKDQCTVIRYRKVLVNGEEKIKILGFDNCVSEDNLPTKYMEGYPNYHGFDQDRIVLATEDQSLPGFPSNDRYSDCRGKCLRQYLI